MNGYEIVNCLDMVVDYAPCIVSAQRRIDGLMKRDRLLYTYRPVQILGG